HMTVPHRCFSHFYMVGFAFNLALLILALSAPSDVTAFLNTELRISFSALSSSSGNSSYNSSSESIATSTPGTTTTPTSSVQALQLLLHRAPVHSLLFHLHLARRLWESTTLSVSPTSSHMHVSAYLLGLCYYIAAPLSFFLAGHPVTPSEPFSTTGADVISIACHIVGAAVFAWGNLHQHRCHAILTSLRQGGKKGYFIPQGDWFTHVSCPHYLAEIVIYLGLLLSLGSRILDSTLLLMFAWV
ncbi:unnamed protein product, partial [Closterium sp. Naga37s-1]